MSDRIDEALDPTTFGEPAATSVFVESATAVTNVAAMAPDTRSTPETPADEPDAFSSWGDVSEDVVLEGAEDGDPYKFQFPSTQLEMILDPSLNRDLPLPDSALPPTKWSKAMVWYHESETKSGEPVQRVLCLDNDEERYVVVRSTGSELEASQFTSLIIDCNIHPNALPKRIH